MIKSVTLASTLFLSCANADKPVLALVIDDLGYSYDQAIKVLNLPEQHTYAIIPDTTYSKKIAQLTAKNGQETILHMPMQSATKLKIESSALNESMTEDQIANSVINMMSEFPHIKGVNNHMGSRLTEMSYIMRPVMETIKKYNNKLYFLDSRTTPLSKAYDQALKAGVATLKRDIFLDYDHANPESIAFQFKRWAKKADEDGFAVAIAHPHQTTIDLLKQMLPEFSEEYKFSTLSQLIESQQQEKKSWSMYLSHLQKDLKNSKP